MESQLSNKTPERDYRHDPTKAGVLTNHDIGRNRDQCCFETVGSIDHITINQLVSLKAFPNYKIGARRILALRRKKKLFISGSVQLKDIGRPQDLLSTRKSRVESALHEWATTELLLPFYGVLSIQRGYDCDQTY